ncbi:hypothetical protein RN001_009179 [Aquatica leii]|uniref:Uncharacterized protein n=1 Tax=Aquatica leii TaxID=1421715 RepID=A0AAN7SMT3_9COLE|nr:hypothetical protein RN001_009179 [Aquatica leii]
MCKSGTIFMTNSSSIIQLFSAVCQSTNTHSGNLYEHYISDNTDAIKSQLQITELRSLLSKWNVKAIVFVDIFKIIKHHHIQFLLKKFDLATWIAFEHHLEQWEDSIGMPLSPWSCSNQFSPYRRFTQFPSLNDNEPSTSIQFSTILELSTRGSMLVETYNKFRKFDEEQRNSLITLIAKFFEKLEYYRTSKMGRLYAKYCNITTSFKKWSSKTKPEENAEMCIKALKYDNLSSEEFDVTWKACCQFRLQFIKDHPNTAEIMEKLPFYKNPSGFRLIDIDFQASFRRDGLLTNWENIFNKLLLFLTTENHIKDRNVKSTLVKMIKNNTISENGRNAALIWALHGYFVPTNGVIRKDATGKKSIIKFTIKDSQESVIFMGGQEVGDQINHLKRTKLSLQPSIYYVGDSIFDIRDIFINFDNIRFQFTNIIRSLDICFKIIYLFDMQFPTESEMFYNFLETFFYKFECSNVHSKVKVLSEYLCSE